MLIILKNIYYKKIIENLEYTVTNIDNQKLCFPM